MAAPPAGPPAMPAPGWGLLGEHTAPLGVFTAPR